MLKTFSTSSSSFNMKVGEITTPTFHIKVMFKSVKYIHQFVNYIFNLCTSTVIFHSAWLYTVSFGNIFDIKKKLSGYVFLTTPLFSLTSYWNQGLVSTSLLLPFLTLRRLSRLPVTLPSCTQYIKFRLLLSNASVSVQDISIKLSFFN